MLRKINSLFFILVIGKMSMAQNEIPHTIEKPAVQTFAPIAWEQIEAYNKTIIPKKFEPSDKYVAKNDTNINTVAKINRRVIGFSSVASTESGIPRKNSYVANRNGENPEANALSGACFSYEMLGDNNTSYPPDISSAGGFDHTMITLNSQVRIRTKAGTTVSTVSLNAFTSATGEGDVFDPKIVFDHHNSRWISIACVARRSSTSGFIIGTSANADPQSSWYWIKVDGDPGDSLWFDYPSMGFTYDKVVVTGNMFKNVNDVGIGGRAFVIDKSTLQSFNPPTVTQFNNIHFTTVPAVTFGNGGTLYMTATHDGQLAQLYLYSITGNSTTPAINNLGVVDYGAGNGWAGGLGNILPQKGSAIKLDGNDERMMSCVYRNGKIWWSNSFYWPLANPFYAGVQYGVFNASTRATIDFAGLWDNSGAQMFAYPNIMVNDDEDMGISCGYFTSNIYATAAYGSVNGGLGLGNLTWNVSRYGDTTYVNGWGTPIRYRWGDYFGIGLDPTDGKSMWLNGQYAAHRGAGDPGNFATFTTKLCATCVTNLTVTTAQGSTAVKKFEATNNVTATNLITTGAKVKYDAGNAVILSPGFRATSGSDVKVFIEGCGGAN